MPCIPLTKTTTTTTNQPTNKTQLYFKSLATSLSIKWKENLLPKEETGREVNSCTLAERHCSLQRDNKKKSELKLSSIHVPSTEPSHLYAAPLQCRYLMPLPDRIFKNTITTESIHSFPVNNKGNAQESAYSISGICFKITLFN